MKRKNFNFIIITMLLLPFTVFGSSLDQGAKKVADFILANKNSLPGKNIAIADFTDLDGNESIEGKLLAQKIIAYLTGKDLKVIERCQLKEVLQEKELATAGLTECDDLSTIGQLVKADAIVIGTITELDKSTEITAKIVNTSSGEIIKAKNISLSKIEIKENDIKMAPEELKEEIKEQKEEEERIRKENPQFLKYRKNIKIRLLNLRKNHPEKFKIVIKFVRRIERLKYTHPRVFLLITEPPNSPAIKQLRKERPRVYQLVRETRKILGKIIKYIPEYKEKLRLERAIVKARIKRRKPLPRRRRPRR